MWRSRTVQWLSQSFAVVAALFLAGATFAEDPPARTEKKPAADATNKTEKTDDAKADDDKPAREEAAEKPVDEKPEEKPAEEKPADAKPAVPGVFQPFADLIKRLVPGKPAPPMPVQPNATGENKDDKPKKPRHPADGRAPYDPKKAQLFSRAQGQIDRQNWSAALDLLQRISEDPEDSLVQSTDGRWVSLRMEVDRLRGQAPADLLKAYRTQYDEVAQAKLGAALASGEAEGLGHILAAWFHTESGIAAANSLAAWHVDRGEFLLAGRLYARLWEASASGTKDPQWRLRAAYTLAKGGEVELGRKILAAAPAVTVPDSDGDTEKWLAAASTPMSRPQPELKEWPAFFGGPRRNAKSAGDEPLLLPRWNVPLTERAPVRERLKQMQEDMIDGALPALPQMSPVMIGGRVAFRTLHGIQVVDALSGKLLWQTEDDIPVESAIAGQGFGTYDAWGNIRFGGRVFVGGAANFAGDSSESGPLANLLFRNANFGLVSSDGERLFVVEDPLILSGRMPGMGWWWWNDGGQPQASANKLAAYHLGTGRPLWEVGSESNGEPFEPPLTGHFFFGPPLADRGELLVVGEHDNEIRLFALDPTNGRPKWGQLIGLSESGIGTDVGRRWWTSQVACSEGIVVCLTTTGWVVAVDRATHSLLWGAPIYPPTETQESGPADQQKMVTYASLTQRWTNAPPVIAGDRVIVTVPNPYSQGSPDPQHLLCLQLGTGKELWRKPRGEMVALAGVFGDRVVMIKHRGLAAHSLADGKELWNRPLAASDSLVEPVPAGRGVAVGSRYYLPLSNGEVWAVDLDKGEVVSRAFAAEGELGNLAMYEGMLLSLGVTGMTAFEQRRSVVDEIARRKMDNPRDPWALVREAEIHVLQRKHPEALVGLRQVDRAAVPAELAGRFRSLMIECLTAEIRQRMEQGESAALLEELRGFVQSPEEQRQFRRLLADRQAAAGEATAAFDALLSLAAEAPQELVDLDGQSGISVRTDLWAAGRLEDLSTELEADSRATLDTRIQDLAQAALGQSPDDQARFLRLFGWHAAAQDVRWKLLEHFAEKREFLKAERLLAQLSRAGDATVKAKALNRRAQLVEQFDLKPDAARMYAELVEQYPDSPEAVAAKAAGKNSSPAEADTLNWHGRTARVERLGTNYYHNNYVQALMGDPRLPFYRRYSMEIPQQEQRLELTDALTDKVVWSQPLRSRNGSDGSLALVEVNGYQLTVLHHGVLQVLSPVERKVLWALNPESRHQQTYYPGNVQNPIPALQPRVSLANRQTRRRPMGQTSLSVANAEYVCRQDRRSMSVHDGLTGELLWTVAGVRTGTRCYGHEDRLYLLIPAKKVETAAMPAQTRGLAINILGGRIRRTSPARRSDPSNQEWNLVLHRPRDGMPLDIAPPNLADLADRTLDIVEGDLIVANPHESQKPVVLRRFDPVLQADRWKHEFPAGTLMSLLDDGDLALLDKATGKFERLNLRSGKRVLLGEVPPADLKRDQIHAFADLDRVYLAVNGSSSGVYYYNYDGLQNLRISGNLYAFDAAQGKLAWKQKIDNNTLVLERLDYTPFLVFFTQQQKKNLPIPLLHVVVHEKTVGDKLADQSMTHSYSGMRNLLINASDAYVEVRGYQERIRVFAQSNAAAPQSPPAPK